MSVKFFLIMVLAIFIGIALLLAAGYVLISWRIANFAIHPKKVDYGTVQREEMERNNLDPHLLDLKYDKIFHTNIKGQELVGRLYCTQTQTNRYILFNHGYNYPWISALKYLPMLLSQGFNVFVPDHQGEGESQGEYITFGYNESKDSLEWLDELKKHAAVSGFEKAEIGVMGESMGAVISLLMASQGAGLLFCIADCPFSNWNKMMEIESKKKFHLYINPFLVCVRWFIRRTTGADLRKADPMLAAAKIKIPTLLFHGRDDPLVPCEMSEELAGENSKIRLVIIDGAKHMNCFATDPQKYKKSLFDFLATIHFDHSEEFIM